MIDARLHGERDRVLPRVFARPLEIRRGEGISEKELIDRLNDLGYAQRTQVENIGEFAVAGGIVTHDSAHGSRGRQDCDRELPAAGAAAASRPPQPAAVPSTRVEAISVTAKSGERRNPDVSRVTLDAPMLTALVRSQPRETPTGAALRDPQPDGAGGAGDRGPAVLLASRRRSYPDGRRAVHEHVRQPRRISKAPAPSHSSWRAIFF